MSGNSRYPNPTPTLHASSFASNRTRNWFCTPPHLSDLQLTKLSIMRYHYSEKEFIIPPLFGVMQSTQTYLADSPCVLRMDPNINKNYIHVETLPNRSSPHLCAAYSATQAFFRKLGHN